MRNVGMLLTQRGLHIVGALLFAALVPRLMGSDIYGRYVLLTSLSIWFVLFSSLGFTQVIGRYVPQLTLQGDQENLEKFFGSLLRMRLASGALAAGLYLLLTTLWLRDLDPLVLIIVASTVLVHAISDLFFALFLGLNQAARWGMGEIVRRWLLLALLLLGFYLGGLRGACLALLLTELVVLSIGIGWARSYLSWPNLSLDVRQMAPYLRFGLIFFASNLFLTAFRSSGEAMIRAVSGDYSQVSYFGVAYAVYLTAALVLPQLTIAFAPLFISLLTQGQTQAMRQWVERLLKGLAVGGMLVVFGVLLLREDLVPLVLGSTYRPVAANLVPLALTLLVVALSSVARLLALVHDQPRVALAASCLRLAVFWALGPPLIAWQGSLGGCLAVLAASAVYGAYFTWRMGHVMRYSLRTWALVVTLGGLFLPLLWLRSSWPVNVALYGAFVVGYSGVLFLLRVITLSDVTATWRAISPRGQVSEATVRKG